MLKYFKQPAKLNNFFFKIKNNKVKGRKIKLTVIFCNLHFPFQSLFIFCS